MTTKNEVLRLFASSFGMTLDEVQEIALTDWSMARLAELEEFGTEPVGICPFIRDEGGNYLRGEKLAAELLADHKRFISFHGRVDQHQKKIIELLHRIIDERVQKI